MPCPGWARCGCGRGRSSLQSETAASSSGSLRRKNFFFFKYFFGLFTDRTGSRYDRKQNVCVCVCVVPRLEFEQQVQSLCLFFLITCVINSCRCCVSGWTLPLCGWALRFGRLGSSVIIVSCVLPSKNVRASCPRLSSALARASGFSLSVPASSLSPLTAAA